MHLKWRTRLIPFLIALLTTVSRPGHCASAELERYRAQLLSQGEILDLDQLAPKRTGNEPDGEARLRRAYFKLNGGMIGDRSEPYLGLYSWQSTKPGYLRLNKHLSSPAQVTNLTTQPVAWKTLESQVAGYREDIVFLCQKLENPPSERGKEYRLGHNYPDTLTGGIYFWKPVVFLSLAVAGDLHAQRNAEAYATLQGVLNLTEYMQDEHTITIQFLRGIAWDHASKAIWYSLELHAWNEEQLKTIQARCEQSSLLPNTFQAVLYERAFVTRAFNIARQQHPPPGLAGSLEEQQQKKQFFLPDWDDYELDYLQTFQKMADIWREQMRSPRWAQGKTELETVEKQPFTSNSPTFPIKKHLNYDNTSTNHYSTTFAFAANQECSYRLTIVAIALERYRLKNTRHPNTLGELVPDFLSRMPLDPMDGRPMRYRLNPDGTFTLWSVGFDGQDNGGDATMPNPKKQNFPQYAKDLVWPRIDPIDLPPKK
jgi:hypothetical protein